MLRARATILLILTIPKKYFVKTLTNLKVNLATLSKLLVKVVYCVVSILMHVFCHHPSFVPNCVWSPDEKRLIKNTSSFRWWSRFCHERTINVAIFEETNLYKKKWNHFSAMLNITWLHNITKLVKLIVFNVIYHLPYTECKKTFQKNVFCFKNEFPSGHFFESLIAV